ncbi:hypothetical protein QLQ09_15880 [Brucella sp. NM4]|uniref:hypothetical protein n=1 Tax=Brucella sp. NM4 TaxID=3045175 RepID=UPI0024BD15EF|nr:hypothetical protein [Brucella sp. NM4]WHS31284.1 hypothetical protein QLQ09_15880 [Brucella sp. NM4]
MIDIPGKGAKPDFPKHRISGLLHKDASFFSKFFYWRVDSWKIDRYTPAHFTGAAASAKRVGD